MPFGPFRDRLMDRRPPRHRSLAAAATPWYIGQPGHIGSAAACRPVRPSRRLGGTAMTGCRVANHAWLRILPLGAALAAPAATAGPADGPAPPVLKATVE